MINKKVHLLVKKNYDVIKIHSTTIKIRTKPLENRVYQYGLHLNSP